MKKKFFLFLLCFLSYQQIVFCQNHKIHQILGNGKLYKINKADTSKILFRNLLNLGISKNIFKVDYNNPYFSHIIEIEYNTQEDVEKVYRCPFDYFDKYGEGLSVFKSGAVIFYQERTLFIIEGMCRDYINHIEAYCYYLKKLGLCRSALVIPCACSGIEDIKELF